MASSENAEGVSRMKRTIPLLITAIGGFVLIVAFFIPATESWGEVAAIWFDILASIAFLLGGGNLLKVHLKKISDRPAGWGYSGVTIIAFLFTLIVGLLKIGTHPAPNQEFYGETFVPLPLAAFPESQITSIPGEIPAKTDHAELPASLRRQLSQNNGMLVFRGWMSSNQKQDLMKFQEQLAWQCTVEKLFDEAQPPDPLKGKANYIASHRALSYRGAMADTDRDLLLAMSDDPLWKAAVDQLSQQSRVTTSEPAKALPEPLRIPASLTDTLSVDRNEGLITLQGPMSVSQRDQLARQYPAAKPLSEEQRNDLRAAIDPLTAEQTTAFDKILNTTWSVEQLRIVLDIAGQAVPAPKTACELLEEMTSEGHVESEKKPPGESVSLNERQIGLLGDFAASEEMTAEQLLEQLRAAGDFTPSQSAALNDFLAKNPTVGQREKMLCRGLLRVGPLTHEQRDYLLTEYRNEVNWRTTVGKLFIAAHTPKYVWTGQYREQGSSFWWMFEYAFKPLTATMFAMLAFYVASAAFRAFRAKNVEASLLLGTAFIILLGQTFAGVLLTSWLPDSLSALRIENLTVYIMSVFNTAGNRAIMIGIALGIASTSLKVLLGVDRSYLGSQDE
jgi:hypothetical protein